MEIANVNVWGLAESAVAAGLAMQPAFSATAYDQAVAIYRQDQATGELDRNADELRMERLNRHAGISGIECHLNALCGVIVQANVTATNAWWLQCERYHFLNIVCMQSKMHRLQRMLTEDTAGFHQAVSPDAVAWLKKLNESGDFEELVYNCPLGLELTARISTNYLQLRTICKQRSKHKLQEWRDFCAWMKTLPCSWLITGEEE